MKKILIIGPFKDKGGRELMSSFIANTLSNHFIVDIISTDNMTKTSEVHKNYKNGLVSSVKEILFRENFLFRFFSYLAFLKNGRINRPFNFVNNVFNKQFGYSEKVYVLLQKLVLNYDLIFINAQLTSNYVDQIVDFSFTKMKHVVFRTSGTIYNSQVNIQYLNKVSLFIHHSTVNAKKIENLTKDYTIIDQCSFIEKKLLAIPISKEVINFVFIGRFAKDKGVDELISYFVKYATNKILYLNIYGEGELEASLKNKYKNFINIKFNGYIPRENLNQVFERNDCLIIPSFNEGGPLVGIEAMAAGKLILSTRVGAMEERLIDTKNDFWFDINNYTSFTMEMDRLLNTKLEERIKISFNLRKRYLENYSSIKISNKFISAIKAILK